MESVSIYYKIMEGLRRISSLAEQQAHPFCSANGITSLQLQILLTLHHDGPQTVTGLARRSCMAGGNNSALCKRMENEGLVARNRDPADERQVMVSLTPKGEALAKSFAEACSSNFDKQTNRPTPEDVETIMAGVQTLLRYLEETAP